MSEVALRPAGPDDAPALAAFASRAFVDAFGTLYSAEDLASFLAAERSEDAYRAKLADPRVRVQLAQSDGAIAAYALVVRGEAFEERPKPRPERPLFLSQLYCARQTTGHGIGAKLMDWVLADAREWGADAVQLSVFSENYGAQRFYQRYGFAKVADIDFWVGNQRDDEFLYELAV